jgi:large subunit ribosomal protein L13Ae
MFEKVVVVDCAGHMLGRVASILAKELVNGQKVVCVRTEELCISGSLFRHKLIYGKFLIHRGNTKPSRGPNHYRSPSRILWRTVRGMMNHFKQRCQKALGRLKVFEGCPHPFDRMKKQVIPAALRVLRLRPGRKFCRLGDLSQQVGWQHDGLIKQLEEKRKTKAAAWYQTKKQIAGLKVRANEAVDKKLGIEKKVPAKPIINKGGADSKKKPAAGKDSKSDKKDDKKKDGKKDGKKDAKKDDKKKDAKKDDKKKDDKKDKKGGDDKKKPGGGNKKA